MKLWLAVEEFYPVLTLDTDERGGDQHAEFSEYELEEYKKTCREFERWQHKIAYRFQYKRIMTLNYGVTL